MALYPVDMDNGNAGEAGAAPDGRRLTVALSFKYQEKWIGGLYYVRNLVSALGLLPAELRPRLVLVDDDPRGLDYLREETGYSDLRRMTSRPRGSALAGLGWRALIPQARRGDEPPVDVVLLGTMRGLEHRSVQWIPDFQEERFPEFFRAGEIHARRRLNSSALAKHRHVMVSSEDTKRDLELYYGGTGNRIHVVRFASFADSESINRSSAELRERYRLPERFLICNNQIWRHKNHALALRALSRSAAEGDAPTIAFTGREHDYRDHAYAPSIKALAEELGLGEKTRFLGFLPRADQLGLISASVAVVQPSLCEGWSAAVEDAKALGKHVLASDIAVHREQLDRNVDFFAPDDVEALAQLFRRYRDADPRIEFLDYGQSQEAFARILLQMLGEVAGDPDESRARRVRRRTARLLSFLQGEQEAGGATKPRRLDREPTTR